MLNLVTAVLIKITIVNFVFHKIIGMIWVTCDLNFKLATSIVMSTR